MFKKNLALITLVCIFCTIIFRSISGSAQSVSHISAEEATHIQVNGIVTVSTAYGLKKARVLKRNTTNNMIFGIDWERTFSGRYCDTNNLTGSFDYTNIASYTNSSEGCPKVALSSVSNSHTSVNYLSMSKKRLFTKKSNTKLSSLHHPKQFNQSMIQKLQSNNKRI